MPLRGNGIPSGYFGDGSDGSVVVTGTLVLSRDMNYRTLVMSGTAAGAPTVYTNSFRVNVSSRLIFLTSGTFDNSGNPGAGSVGGIVPRPMGASGSLASYGDGGVGGAPGLPGATGSSLFGLGGEGGHGATSTGAGGPGGSILTGSATVGTHHEPFTAMIGCMFGHDGPTSIGGGAGGGGGGGSGANGSGGGAGGGVLVIAAREILVGASGTYIETGSIVNPGYPYASGTYAFFSGTVYTRVPSQSGTIRVDGGAGAGGGSPGGGGGGGALFLFTCARPTLTGTFGSLVGTHSGFSSSVGIIPELASGTLLLSAAGGAGGGAGASSGLEGTVYVLDV